MYPFPDLTVWCTHVPISQFQGLMYPCTHFLISRCDVPMYPLLISRSDVPMYVYPFPNLRCDVPMYHSLVHLIYFHQYLTTQHFNFLTLWVPASTLSMRKPSNTNMYPTRSMQLSQPFPPFWRLKSQSVSDINPISNSQLELNGISWCLGTIWRGIFSQFWSCRWWLIETVVEICESIGATSMMGLLEIVVSLCSGGIIHHTLLTRLVWLFLKGGETPLKLALESCI